MTTGTEPSIHVAGMTRDEKFVIFASSLGSVFEFYDLSLYAVLAPFFASLFFSPGTYTAALLSAFATHAAGFLVRPFGALIFGRHWRPCWSQIHIPGHHHGDGHIDLPCRPPAYLREHRLVLAGILAPAPATGPCSRGANMAAR